MNINKINVLEGEWLHGDYENYEKQILPQLRKANISTFDYKIIPLTYLYNDSYWASLRQDYDSYFAVIDPHHWFYDDLTFAKYLQTFSSVSFPVVCIESFSFDRAMFGIDIDAFYEKLFERTKLISDIVRKNHPGTIILSPPISVLNSDHYNRCLDYFVHNRQYFDVYAVHCVNDMSEHSLGRMASLLNQIMKILPKEIWITKWAIPSFEGLLVTEKLIGSSEWEPINYKVAAQRLRRSFVFVESVATLGSKWFYGGFGKDLYHPRYLPGPHEFWTATTRFVERLNYLSSWDFSHFLGMITFENVIKKPVLDAFLKLAEQHNV